ncbi:putative oxidoreductase family protein [Luminiphilus syltensis NOR5-1B]|uniref:Pyridine nucleotide-disulfide oxidoreductase domain-containing protein 2 n=1 Tax=Luminiphilus syltensis NOR5-1B TaxID=565045 RepID=B8KTU7_9GAMM|nr:NAD(P)/FAD-dependent oxidoreductase [Luminiphilus syltensis]EED35285.1 putative oxidoreductase family protein [Luminiphilus syltensis NOR5-1B]
MKQDYDVIVIGGGHNGLTCAGYLAGAGQKVLVLERRDKVGGAAVTEEFHPGFRNTVYSYSVSLLHPAVIKDLQLEEHGLEIMERSAGSLSLLEGDTLQLTRDGEQAKREIARFSKRDAERIDAFENEIEVVAKAVRALAMEAPPNMGGGLRDLWNLAKGGNALRKLDAKHQMVLGELMTRSLGDHLDSWFEGEALKGLLGFEGIIGNFADPYQPGTAYVLLHHAFGEVNGKTGAWGIARGGMGAISDSMAASARARGVTIETNAAVEKILVERGHACGVVTEDGREFRAKQIAANVHPQILLNKLLGDEPKAPDDQRRIDAYRSHSATFRMNVAISELPQFTQMKGKGEFHFEGAIELCQSLPYIRDAYDTAKSHGWSQRPIVSMQIPSTQDDTLAPKGAHVASLFCQHFQRHLPNGQNWDDVREQVADHVIDAIDRQAPNFKASVVGRQIKTPLDIERDLNMVGGDIFHGALHLDQFYSMRPIPGHAAHKMPTEGVYLCGSGAHPGGGVSGLPGRNAAKVILRER